VQHHIPPLSTLKGRHQDLRCGELRQMMEARATEGLGEGLMISRCRLAEQISHASHAAL
jgi:hypothetical protein